jgi:hypothetical protein
MNNHIFLSSLWRLDPDDLDAEKIPAAIKELERDLRTLEAFYSRGELLLERLQSFVESEKLRPGQMKGLKEWNEEKARRASRELCSTY